MKAPNKTIGQVQSRIEQARSKMKMVPSTKMEREPSMKIEQVQSTMTGQVQSRMTVQVQNMKIEQVQSTRTEVRNIQKILIRRKVQLARSIPWTVQSRMQLGQRMKMMVQNILLRSWIRRSSCPSTCRQSRRQRWPGSPHDRCCSQYSTKHCPIGPPLRRSRPRRNTKPRRQRQRRTSFWNFLGELLIRN